MKHFDRKILIGILLIVFLFLPMLGGAVYSLRQVVSAQNELVSNYAEVIFLSKDLRFELSEQRSAIPLFILTGQQGSLDAFNQSNFGFANTLTRLQGIIQDPKEARLLRRIDDAQQKLAAIAVPGIALKKSGASIKTVHQYFTKNSAPLMISLEESILDFSRSARARFEQEKENDNRISKEVIHFLGLASLLAVILCFLIAGLMMKLVRQKKLSDETNDRLAAREKQLSSARKEVVEVVAHDLKNPLASILMSTELALRAYEKNHKATDGTQKVLNLISRSALSMKRLIDDLLDHTKIEAQELVLSPKECDLDFFLASLALRFKPIAAQKNLNFVTEIPETLPFVLLDEGRMEQVVSNLLGNAFKFTPAGGTVCFRAKIVDFELRVEVSDTGRGMTRSELGHIFERYWQSQEVRSQGTGLGLAISKAIIEAHAGRIWVESEIGQGSRFGIAIPIREIKEPVHRLPEIPPPDQMSSESFESKLLQAPQNE